MPYVDFAHLHVHTQYSLLDGACHLNRLIDKAREFKFPALAITDHGNIFGAIEFYELCYKKGIKPIIGVECYLAGQCRFEKKTQNMEESAFHLLLLARNEKGYKNLIKLVSLGYLEGFYYKPRIDKELLNKYSEGLIGLSACLKGEIPRYILQERIPQAIKTADEYQHILGKGNFYLEIMENGLPEQKTVNKALLKISRELGIPLVATNDVHYLEPQDAFAHEVLLCIQTQTTLSNPQRMKFGSKDFYLRSGEEMKTLFKDLPEAIKNSLQIAEKCNLKLDFSKFNLPRFPLPPHTEENTFLRELCLRKLPERYPRINPGIIKRLEHELKIIKQTGFASYFLIIWDLVKFAKENGIPVGPGRGSAAGSIVSYILGITDIDPLKYNLIFERFLNPERVSLPDIDIDFCYEKRQKVLEYVARKYGQENVAQIITFGTMLSRAVVRDVGRVLDFSYSEVDKIAKLIPHEPGMTLRKALEINPELKSIYQKEEKVKQLIDTAFHLEGLSRHASIHAAGVVIADKPLTEYLPLFKTPDEQITTGYDMKSLEKIGLLKMDFLGLKTLTVIEETLKIIKRRRNEVIDIGEIPLDDKKTYQLLSKGKTIGVFQVESAGMRELLKRLQPQKFEDLIAVLALYRPGPIGSGMLEDFIQRKHQQRMITYLHPKLEPILKETYGIIVYQEQVMQIASALAGFSLAQADFLRRAMGKKIPEVMEEQRKHFLEGCRKNNIPENTANKIFDLMEYFSGYGFNKSHSTAYALISYRTAYLKANYPVEFMASLLTSEKDNTDKIVEYVSEARNMGIEILPPDINESFANFTVVGNNQIRFGLLAIKNVGEAALNSIMENRKKEGKFHNLLDFCMRLDSKATNKKILESLIKCGAMDKFGKRAQLMNILPKIMEISTKRQKEKKSTQLSIFEDPFLLGTEKKEIELPQIEEWPKQQLLQFEKDLLGFYITGHPLNKYQNFIRKLRIPKIKELPELNSSSREITLTGLIEKIKLTTTRKTKELMAILRIEDETAFLEVFVFPRLYQEISSYLKKGNIILVKGKVNLKERIPKLIASKITRFDEIYNWITSFSLYIEEPTPPLMEKVKEILLRYSGQTPVYFNFKHPELRFVKIKPEEDYFVSPQEGLFKEIAELLGEENFSLTLS